MMRRNERRRTTMLAALAAVVVGAAGVSAVPAQAAPRVPARPGDFNGDGRRDLALGSPWGTAGGVERAGFVTVVYGADPARRQVISQSSPGMPGGSEQYDQFGSSLASADFNLDGYADLAVVAAGEDNDGPITGGQITLVYGGASGLSSSGAVRFGDGAATVDAADVDHDGEPDLVAGHAGAFAVYRDLASGDLNGTVTRIGQGEGEIVTVATTAADFTGDGYADVAIGIVWLPIDGDDAWVRLNVYPGSAGGVATTPAFTESEVRVRSLAAGDVNGDGKADLVAGVDALGGEVIVYPGASSGLGDPTVINQDTEGVPGTHENYDRFGASVATGDVNGDGRADIAVGAPGEDIGATNRAGAATVLYGGPDGVSGAGAQQFGQASAGVPGSAEARDGFGSAVALIDLNGDGMSEFTVGSEGENDQEGSVYLFTGTASGVTTDGIRAFSSGTLGVEGLHAGIGGVILP